MDFRDTMDKIWRSSALHYLNMFLFGMLLFGHRILPFSRDVIFIGFCATIAVLMLFKVYFLKTINRGYDDVIRIFKPVAIKEEKKKAWLMILVVFLTFGLVQICIRYDEYRGIAFTLLIILIFIFGLLFYFSSSSSEINRKNNFVRVLFTRTRLIVDSHGNKISKFDRSALKYDFINEEELVLVGENQDPQKEITVNLIYLPEVERQELRTLLGEETKNLNRVN